MGEIVTYIREIKKGNSSFFSNVVDKMMPSMKKYISRLYKDEKDDVYVELMAALWEAIIKTEYLDEEGKCITYLNNALNNKFNAVPRHPNRNSGTGGWNLYRVTGRMLRAGGRAAGKFQWDYLVFLSGCGCLCFWHFTGFFS